MAHSLGVKWLSEREKGGERGRFAQVATGNCLQMMAQLRQTKRIMMMMMTRRIRMSWAEQRRAEQRRMGTTTMSFLAFVSVRRIPAGDEPRQSRTRGIERLDKLLLLLAVCNMQRLLGFFSANRSQRQQLLHFTHTHTPVPHTDTHTVCMFSCHFTCPPSVFVA